VLDYLRLYIRKTYGVTELIFNVIYTLTKFALLQITSSFRFLRGTISVKFKKYCMLQ